MAFELAETPSAQIIDLLAETAEIWAVICLLRYLGLQVFTDFCQRISASRLLPAGFCWQVLLPGCRVLCPSRLLPAGFC